MDRSAGLAELHKQVSMAYTDFVDDLGYLVDIDSGTFTASGVDEVSGWLMERLAALGATIERYPQVERGDVTVAVFERSVPGPTILLLGHADTVFEAGTASARPFRADGRRAYGPGVADMKSGLLTGLYALRALRGRAARVEEWLPAGRVVFVVSSDEEIGSPASAPVIRERCREASAALVLEGGRPHGEIVSSRSGLTHLRISITGRAAHAGVEPEKGRSAVLEAARQTVALHELSRRWPGVSVNVGEIQGGSRPNIVPAEATITVDVRARTRVEQEAAQAAIEDVAAKAAARGTNATVEVLARMLPMEPSEATERLVDGAASLARELGFKAPDIATGGGSDGNTTAAAGVPTLDGLGPVGGDRHAATEYIELESIVPRTTWLAAIIRQLGRDRSLTPR